MAELIVTHPAFDSSEEGYSPWSAGYVASQSGYPHGEISHQKAIRAAGGSPWSDEVLIGGQSPEKPDLIARKELAEALLGYGLAEPGGTAEVQFIDEFIEGSYQGEIDIRDGVRL